jgi:hypothetical protein
MVKIKEVNNFNLKGVAPFEHLEFILKNTTPYNRLVWLGQAYELWSQLRKGFSPKMIALQDKFRAGKI